MPKLPAWPLFQAGNPLTFPKLLETITFQVGLLGSSLVILSLVAIPWFARFEARAMLRPKGPKRVLPLMLSYLPKGVAFILLTGTLGILLTDVGWPAALQRYGLPTALLFARASGAPNGAHLLSYIPLPFLGLYVAWKYRKDWLLDCYQGIMVVAFGVAVHESIWLVAYWLTYARYWNLGVATNVAEDFFFLLMCLMFLAAYWKYPYRTLPLRAFRWPVAAYAWLVMTWYAWGLPVSTINNWQLGQGIYMTTQWWADPWVNGMEIASWVFVAMAFFLAIWWYEAKKRHS